MMVMMMFAGCTFEIPFFTPQEKPSETPPENPPEITSFELNYAEYRLFVGQEVQLYQWTLLSGRVQNLVNHIGNHHGDTADQVGILNVQQW